MEPMNAVEGFNVGQLGAFQLIFSMVRYLACATALALSSANLPAAQAATLMPSQSAPELQLHEAALAGLNGPEEVLDVSADSVKRHLIDTLSSESFGSFKLFVYINKGRAGPRAQHMYVFTKTDAGDLTLLHEWPVSTGREGLETDPHGHHQSTATPTGFYQLDAGRLYEQHTSGQWNEPMPYAMFFSWTPNGRKTGLAIHGTAPAEARQLGTAASAGCVRLSEDNARTLFNLVRAEFHSSAIPQLAYLNGNMTISSEGLLQHDAQGQLALADGYSVLVEIDDYNGENRETAQR